MGMERMAICMRAIYCEGCDPKPLFTSEYAQGLRERRVTGWLIVSCLCDSCAKVLERGDPAVAYSAWRGFRMALWEHEYLVSPEPDWAKLKRRLATTGPIAP